MSFIQTIPSGKDFEFSGDLKTGLLTQNPQYGPSTNTWSADGDMEFGTILAFRGLHKLTGNSAAQTSTITYVSSCPYKLRLVRMTAYPRTLGTGGTPDHDISVRAGTAGDTVIATCDVDTTLDSPVVGIINDANELIAVGDIITSILTIGATTPTTGGVSLVDVLFECMRVKA